MSVQPAVLVVVGSKSDSDHISDCLALLDALGIGYDFEICSAHRNPERTAQLAVNAKAKGYKAIIAAAGMAAALPGVLASQTNIPVIGVPLPGSALNGVDALYSMVQMPAGVPVAVMAIGKAGAKNAAILAAQIIGLENKEVANKLEQYKQTLKQG
jgi:5-(carboxyamino)imidazole ribonucleotide mutase